MVTRTCMRSAVIVTVLSGRGWLTYLTFTFTCEQSICLAILTHNISIILVKVPCMCIKRNIARRCGREPIKHKVQPYTLFTRDHATCPILSIMHERERYINWLILAAFLAFATPNDSKWALRS